MSFKIKALEPVRTILVIESGFVLHGMCRYIPETDEVEVTDGAVIRSWGTSRGLGQLAMQGPQKDTKLDPITTTWVPMSKILWTLSVTYQGEW